jgi:hypothetical protein
MMTSLDIEIALANFFNPRRNIIVPNVWFGMGLNHECDLMVMTRAGYVYEIEIKISKADLVRDMKKWHGHRDGRIKKLYFCIPESLFEECQNLIPEQAGIIVCDGNFCVRKREAKATRIPPLDAEAREKLYQLAAMRVWTLKYKLRDVLKKDKENPDENKTGF